MSDDPLDGVSARALAAAGGDRQAMGDAAVEDLVAPLASKERVFERRTREASRRRAAASRGTAGAIADPGARIAEGWDALPDPKAALRRGRAAIGDRPSTALLVAGAIGFGIGWLIHHRAGDA